MHAVSPIWCHPYASRHKTDCVHEIVLHSLFVSQGINSLLARGVYDSAFPLHDVSVTKIAASPDTVEVFLLRNSSNIVRVCVYV